MNMLLSVFVLLCVGAVYCGRPAPGTEPTGRGPPSGPGPTPPGPEPTGRGPPSGPGPTPPGPEPTGAPWWELKRCNAQHGGWYYVNVQPQDWPISTNPNIFYFGCKAWRPTWSSCKGFCESSQNITTRTPPRYDTECTCCKSHGHQLVKPHPRCYVIRVNIGQKPTVRFETVITRLENYSYVLAARCGCQDCRRPVGAPCRRGLDGYMVGEDCPVSPMPASGPPSPVGAPGARGPGGAPGPRGPAGPNVPEEIDEDQVTGRPNPPEVSPEEGDEALVAAFGQIPV